MAIASPWSGNINQSTSHTLSHKCNNRSVHGTPQYSQWANIARTSSSRCFSPCQCLSILPAALTRSVFLLHRRHTFFLRWLHNDSALFPVSFNLRTPFRRSQNNSSTNHSFHDPLSAHPQPCDGANWGVGPRRGVASASALPLGLALTLGTLTSALSLRGLHVYIDPELLYPSAHVDRGDRKRLLARRSRNELQFDACFL